MNKMKQFGIKSAWLLVAGAIFALSVTILSSCSSDDDYDMYMGDELGTLAAATRSASAESGGGSTTPKSCGIWCVAELCSDKDYDDVRCIAESLKLPTTTALSTSQLLLLAKESGLSCSNWLTNSLTIGGVEYTDTVANLLKSLGSNGRYSNVIVGYNYHYYVAVELLNGGNRIKVKDPNNNGNTSNYNVSTFVAVVY